MTLRDREARGLTLSAVGVGDLSTVSSLLRQELENLRQCQGTRSLMDGSVGGSHQGHSGTANWGSQGAYLSSSLELDGRGRADVTEGTERSEGAVLERAVLTGMPTERLMAQQRGQED